jgi:hypothetical protein
MSIIFVMTWPSREILIIDVEAVVPCRSAPVDRD